MERVGPSARIAYLTGVVSGRHSGVRRNPGHRVVTPAKAGVQRRDWLDAGIRRHDEDTHSEPCSDVRAHTREF